MPENQVKNHIHKTENQLLDQVKSMQKEKSLQFQPSSSNQIQKQIKFQKQSQKIIIVKNQSSQSDQDQFQDHYLKSYTNIKESTQQINQKIQNQVQNIALMDILKETNPIQQKKIKPDALQYDIKLGWIPKAQVTGPIPVSFANQLIDKIIQVKMDKIIYLGWRPANSFQIHKKFYEQGKKYPFYQFHLFKSQFLDRFFKKYYSEFEYISTRIPGQIIKIQKKSNELQQLQKKIQIQLKKQQIQKLQNQTEEEPLLFDSIFQGGNLDAVYKQDNQYRMMIRMDSNTLGHCNYYNFKVKCTKSGTYRLRIMNINKTKSLYERGMKPYIKNLTDNDSWSQRGQCKSIRFGSSLLNQQFQDCFGKFYSLKFEFQFQKNKQYQFCYGVPYVYSDLMSLINDIRQNPNVHVGKLCHTLSGVEIPLITVRNNEKQQYKHQLLDGGYCVVITARVHPAQTNGSHIVNGLIKTLLKESKQSKFLRKNVIFKIIPMLNPDGVIIGNTRTSFAGKDLNRKYTDKTQFIFPQVIGVRDYVLKLKQKYGDKLLFIVDIHGHSNRKGSFFFGPEYSIMSQQYSKCRLLPKLYASRSNVFRYYSCKFRLSSWKQTTSRGYFNNRNIRAYTHETSMHCYFDFITKKDLPFNLKSLQRLGGDLLISIFDYVFKIKIQAKVFIEKTLLEEVQKEKQQLKKQGQQQVQQQRDSDKMSQQGADSQDSREDLQDRSLQVFYQKINQNRQYFYQELLKQYDSSNLKKDQHPSVKSNKIKQKNNDFQDTSKLNKIDIQAYKQKKRKQRIDWIAKAAYTPKRSLFQEYSKMSSVVIGKKRETIGRSPQFKSPKLKQLTDRKHNMKNQLNSLKQLQPHGETNVDLQTANKNEQQRINTEVLFKNIEVQQNIGKRHSLSLKGNQDQEHANFLKRKSQIIDRQALYRLINSKSQAGDIIKKMNSKQRKNQETYMKAIKRPQKTIQYQDKHFNLKDKQQYLLKKMQKQYTTISRNVKSLSNVSKLPKINLFKKI